MPTATPSAESREFAALLQSAGRHLAANDIGSAKSLLDDGNRRWPEAGRLRLLAGRIAEAEGQPGAAAPLFREAAARLREEAEGLPKDANRALVLAQALIKCGDAAAAEAAFDSARQRGAKETEPVLRTARTLAQLRRDWPEMRRTAAAVLALQADPVATDCLALAIACRNMDDFDGAAAAAAAALDRDPGRVNAATIAAWAAIRQGDAEQAIACYRRLADLAPDNPRWPLQSIRLLILSGRIAEGSSALDAALARWPDDPGLRAQALIAGFRSVEEIPPLRADAGSLDIGALRERQLRQVLDKAPSGAALQRALVVDDKAADVIVAPAAHADTAVLVFTAITDVVAMPLPLFDRYLAALGVTAIYLKDFQRLYYMRGITSLGEDRAATLQALAELCQSLGARRLCTLGSSAGGFAAVHYGVELGADRVLSFAGGTHSAADFAAETNPGAVLIRRRLLAQVSPAELDLGAFLGARQSSSKIELFYPAGAERDRVQARYLEGIAGVTLRSVAGCDEHELLRWLALHDDLLAILQESLAIEPPKEGAGGQGA